jgi:Flp pilus assembly protein TadD
MSSSVAVEIPVAESVLSRYEVAAQVLDRAIQAGCQDPNVYYLLAMAHKRQGKTNDARTALRKIQKPDSNVLLQLGLLSLQENNLAQAEAELLQAWLTDNTSYEICYNLLLTQLTLSRVDECLELLPQAIDLASRTPSDGDGATAGQDERRFLTVLQSLLRSCQKDAGQRPEPLLAELSQADEQRLLKVIRSLGQLDTVHTLLRTLSEARPRSPSVRDAHVESVVVKAKTLMDRCHWTEAELLLRPMAAVSGITRNTQVALFNLLGVCACLTQDFEGAVRHFNAAVKYANADPRLHQNLALTYELKGELSQADPHWNRYFDLLDKRVPAPSDIPNYLEAVGCESMVRLANSYAEKEKWSSAVTYMQRAQRMRPRDPDLMEKIFHFYNSAKRPQDARKVLEVLRQLRPKDPQLDLYELDLIEVKGLTDIERLLTDIEQIRRRYPGDGRVEERAVRMVTNVIPLMGNLCDQLTQQMSKVIDQVRHLPNYQINWSAVREVMRDLMREFQKLQRITRKCAPLVTSEEHKRIIRELSEHIDKKLEACRSMGA